MTRFAYKDKERKEIIYADKALADNLGISYYCPNPDCKAEMYVCQRDGANNPYFRATRKHHGHDKDCLFTKSNKIFDPAGYDESAFEFENAMDRLFTNNSNGQRSQSNGYKYRDCEPSTRPPRTLRQIYKLCKSFPIKETYAGKHIYEMILDNRSVTVDNVDFEGNKIIEAYVRERKMLYHKELREIHLRAPLKSDSYHIILKFDNEKFFYKIKDEIYENKNQTIVIAGNWKKLDEKTLQTNFLSKKQLYIDKNI